MQAQSSLSNESELQRPNPILNMTTASYLHELQEIKNNSQTTISAPYSNIILNRFDANTSVVDGDTIDASELKTNKVPLKQWTAKFVHRR